MALDYGLDATALLTRMGIDYNDIYMEDSPPSSQNLDETDDITSSLYHDEDIHSEQLVPTPRPEVVNEDREYSLHESSEDSHQGEKTATENVATMEVDNDNSMDTEAEEALGNLEVEIKTWRGTNLCPICGTRVGHNNIRRHIKELHENKRYVCKSCKKSFVRKYDFNKHVCKRYVKHI